MSSFSDRLGAKKEGQCMPRRRPGEACVSPQFFFELNIFILTLQVSKLRFSEVNHFVQDYIIGRAKMKLWVCLIPKSLLSPTYEHKQILKMRRTIARDDF